MADSPYRPALTGSVTTKGPMKPPPRPPEPQNRIYRTDWLGVDYPVPPRVEDDFGSTSSNPGASWLWFVVIAALSFILGVSFAEWTR